MKLLLQNDLLKIPAVISLDGWRATNWKGGDSALKPGPPWRKVICTLQKHCPQINYGHNAPQRQQTKGALSL